MGFYLAAVLVCIAGELWINLPSPPVSGARYLYTRPSGARVTTTDSRSATGLAGTRAVDIGVTPGPLQFESNREVLAKLELRGYEPYILPLRKSEFVAHRYPPRGAIPLKPRVPVLVPLVYLMRDHGFLVMLGLVIVGLARLGHRARAELRSERCLEEQLREGKLEEGTPVGPYRLGTLLGAGGMARVFRATRLEDPGGEVLALKILNGPWSRDPEVLARFEREVRIAHSLSHPHIAHLLDWGTVHDHNYLLMELVEGETLAARLERIRPAVGEVIRWGREIAEALAYAHERHIVHRDVKPSNVMVRSDGRAVLMDFGIAKNPVDPLTRAGDVLGTPGYMAPEQLEAEADWRSDLYSLGVLLYESLSGRNPFQAETPLQILAKQRLSELPRLARAEVPEALEELIGRLLRVDPAERPETARQVADALRGIEAELEGN